MNPPPPPKKKALSSCLYVQASDDELDSIQVTCTDLLQTHERLQGLLPNEHVRRRLEDQAISTAQDWSEVYSREKLRLLRSHFDEWRSALEDEFGRLAHEMGEVVEELSEQGFSLELYQRYKVRGRRGYAIY